MLKKWTALVLTAVMALTVFVGCEAPAPQEDAVKTYLEAVRDGNTELMRVADGYTTRDIDFGFARQVIEKKRKKAKIKILSSTETGTDTYTVEASITFFDLLDAHQEEVARQLDAESQQPSDGVSSDSGQSAPTDETSSAASSSAGAAGESTSHLSEEEINEAFLKLYEDCDKKTSYKLTFKVVKVGEDYNVDVSECLDEVNALYTCNLESVL